MSFTSITSPVAVSLCNLIVDRLDQGPTGGLLRIYKDTMPADVDAALPAGTPLLVEIPLADPAFDNAADNLGAAGSGAAVANANTTATSAAATQAGVASFFRAFDSTGTPAIIQGNITAVGGGGAMTMNSTNISLGAQVTISSWIFTVPESGTTP